jgi:general secretion pathway protein K
VSRFTPPERERGAALLAVLLLVAIMGVIATLAFERLRLSTALAINHASIEQARAYAVGVETLLALRADDLVSANRDVTTLAGDWNGTLRRIPLPGEGLAEGTIRDAGNCFNLNSLVQGEPPARLAARPQGVEQFTNLMLVLGVPDREARSVAGAAADWIDSDSDPLPGGGEDAAYAGLETAYRPANTLFAEASELRAVQGVTPELYALIRPFVCALPTNELSPINVNTLLPRDAPLLAMFTPARTSLEAASAIIASRPPAGWREMADFVRASGPNELPLDPSNQLQLNTRWFALDLRIEFGGAELIETALVDARYMPSRVVVRRWGRDE